MPSNKEILKRVQGVTQRRVFTIGKREVDENSRTVELAFSSETPVDRGFYREVLDHGGKAVRLDRLRDGGPVLIDHENSIRSQVGVIESVRIDPDRVGRAVVRLGTDALAEEVLQKVADNIVRNISMMYVVHDIARVEERKDGEPDTYRVTDWEPLEVSFVAVPADKSVGVGRSFEIEEQEEVTMPENTNPTGGTQQANPVDNQAEITRQANEQAKRLFEKEQKRISDIMALGAQHPEVDGAELAAEAIRGETTVQEFQGKILEAIRKKDKESKEGNAPIQYGQGARTHNREEDDAACGFVNFGQFARNVVFASSGRSVDPTLEKRAASVFSSTESGPDGGYAIPPQFGNMIVELALAEQGLLAMAENTPLSGNSLTLPKDEGTPWGTTGVTASWEGEGVQTTPTKNSELEEMNLKLRKLKVLVPASDELIADAAAMSAYLMRKMSTRLEWKVQDAIVNGTGAGMPLGIINSGSIVTQAKETSQTADTIVKENIAKMFGRVLMGAGANLVWLTNPDSYNQVVTLNSGGDLIWSADFRSTPGGLLLGRPVIMTDTCQTLGDKNDIILANMAGYQTATKAGGVQMSQSMHLWFDQDLEAFKLIFRMDGKPLLRAAVTPPNSSVTRSHFVNLAART